MDVLVSNQRLDSSNVIDIGCGKNIHPDADIGIDTREDTNADIIADLTKERLPVESNSISKVYAIDVLEHIPEDIITIIEEIHRILQIGGILVAKVPGKFYDPPSKNPLHARSFDPQWFYSFDPDRHEHTKWNNYTCCPFNVTLSDRERLSIKPWSIIRRIIEHKPNFPPFMTKHYIFQLEKRSACPHHPTISEKDR